MAFFNGKLQEHVFGVTENAVFHSKVKEYAPRTLVDQTLELVDPTPNIHTLFMQFNAKYFSGKLSSVEVKWSNRMTSCAGTCTFHPRSRDCVISLSAPLLKLRPRKDLVETLLHEMIHGFLFLTNNNRDRDGHGPEFQKIMKRINQEAGTNITIYHNFYDEVRLYQRHIWRCNGPCQKKAPYFGTVRRASNRAPSKNDFWWADHQRTCGGEFVKLQEPEKPEASAKKKKKTIEPPEKGSLYKWLTPTKPTTFVDLTSPGSSKKLGNGQNQPTFVGSGILGGSNSGRSRLLDEYLKRPSSRADVQAKIPCPVCGKFIAQDAVNKHLDSCLASDASGSGSASAKASRVRVNCPVCNKDLEPEDVNVHLDRCLESAKNPPKRDSSGVFKLPGSSGQGQKCLICNADIGPGLTLNEHLEMCIGEMFKDETFVVDGDEEDIKEAGEKKFPCPVCMGLVDESLMNEHLDVCLGNN